MLENSAKNRLILTLIQIMHSKIYPLGLTVTIESKLHHSHIISFSQKLMTVLERSKGLWKWLGIILETINMLAFSLEFNEQTGDNWMAIRSEQKEDHRYGQRGNSAIWGKAHPWPLLSPIAPAKKSLVGSAKQLVLSNFLSIS